MTEYTELEIDEIDGAFGDPEKARALAELLDIEPEDVLSSIAHEASCDEYSAGIGEYRVLTDDEADVVWDEYLDSYIDDCLEIPEGMENYFDREAWKRDARMDGRGHSISTYDGSEDEATDPVSGDDFVIFRVG
jgi:hypothetical protein